MPIHRGIDSKGPYYQWGDRKKYYYISGNYRSRIYAYNKAAAQAKAIYSRGYRKGG